MKRTLATYATSVLFLSVFSHNTVCMSEIVPIDENSPSTQNAVVPIAGKPKQLNLRKRCTKSNAQLQQQVLKLTEQVSDLQQTIKSLITRGISPETFSEQVATKTSASTARKTSAKKRNTTCKLPKPKRPHSISKVEAELYEINPSFDWRKSEYRDIWAAIKQDKAAGKTESIDWSSRLSFEGSVVTLKFTDLDNPLLHGYLLHNYDWQRIKLPNKTSTLNGVLRLQTYPFLCEFSNEVLCNIFGSKIKRHFKKDITALVIPDIQEDDELLLKKIEEFEPFRKEINAIIFSMSAALFPLDLQELPFNFGLEISDFSCFLPEEDTYIEVDPAKRWKAHISPTLKK